MSIEYTHHPVDGAVNQVCGCPLREVVGLNVVECTRQSIDGFVRIAAPGGDRRSGHLNAAEEAECTHSTGEYKGTGDGNAGFQRGVSQGVGSCGDPLYRISNVNTLSAPVVKPVLPARPISWPA